MSPCRCSPDDGAFIFAKVRRLVLLVSISRQSDLDPNRALLSHGPTREVVINVLAACFEGLASSNCMHIWSVANCPCFSVLSFAAASPLPACCPETGPGAGSVSPACGLVISCDASSARVVGHAAFSSSVTSSSSDIRDPCSRVCANLAWRLLHAFFSLPIHSGDCAWPMSPSLDMVH